MSDLNTVFGLPQEDEQEPDYNAIFGGGAADDPPIPAEEPDLAERSDAPNEKEPTRKTEKETSPDREAAPTAKKANQSTKREAKEVEEEPDLFSRSTRKRTHRLRRPRQGRCRSLTSLPCFPTAAPRSQSRTHL